jgi:hypothetical protein
MAPLLLPTTNKNLLRAAKIELLAADAINHPSMINEKVESYQRAAHYFVGGGALPLRRETVSHNHDVYSALLSLAPYFCKFLLRTINDSMELLRLAAIRVLIFFKKNRRNIYLIVNIILIFSGTRISC